MNPNYADLSLQAAFNGPKSVKMTKGNYVVEIVKVDKIQIPKGTFFIIESRVLSTTNGDPELVGEMNTQWIKERLDSPIFMKYTKKDLMNFMSAFIGKSPGELTNEQWEELRVSIFEQGAEGGALNDKGIKMYLEVWMKAGVDKETQVPTEYANYNWKRQATEEDLV
jgi:hypothetical protein